MLEHVFGGLPGVFRNCDAKRLLGSQEFCTSQGSYIQSLFFSSVDVSAGLPNLRPARQKDVHKTLMMLLQKSKSRFRNGESNPDLSGSDE